MSKTANIVASSLIGEYCKEIKLGRFTFKIYQPTIKDMCQIFGNSTASINDNIKHFELISQMPEHIKDCARALSFAVSIRKSNLFRILAYKYILNYATMEEILIAFRTLHIVVAGKDLFDSVNIEQVTSNDKSESIGANSIFGAICSLIENLHLSYKEAFEIIPYPCLLMMNADKLRILGANENRVTLVSGRDMMLNKRKGVK